MQGELGELYDEWRRNLLAITAQLEAFIDFPDEELPQDLAQRAKEEAGHLIEQITRHCSDLRGQRLREGFYVVILGAPNVGKSSLLNYLAKQDVAIVSDIAGTTRDAIEVHLDIAGFPVTLCDTAGLRESDDAIELAGITRAKERAENADLALLLMDGTQENCPGPALPEREHTITVVNKMDQENASIPAHLASEMPVAVSVKTGQGMENLLETIKAHVAGRMALGTTPLFTRERHKQLLMQCKEALERFTVGLDESNDLELVGEDLRLAAQYLGKITGKIDTEELLGEIFARFCIGK